MVLLSDLCFDFFILFISAFPGSAKALERMVLEDIGKRDLGLEAKQFRNLIRRRGVMNFDLAKKEMFVERHVHMFFQLRNIISTIGLIFVLLFFAPLPGL